MNNKIIYGIVILVTVLIAVSPWFSEGIAYTDDFRAHTAHLWAMENNMENGHMPFTGWMQELYSGWPIFKFYSLSPYWVSLPFVMVADNAVEALKMSVVASFLIAALSMFFAAKLLFGSNKLATISSVAYTYFGYHFINAGSRGAFNELWGYSFFPLAVGLFIYSLHKPSLKSVILATLATSLIVLTHVPVAWMLAIIYITYYAYFIYTEKKIKKTHIKVISAIFFGSILLTSFWLIPFLKESKNMNFDDFYTDDGMALIGLHGNTGVEISSLITRHFGNMPDGTRAFYVGYSLLALLAIGLYIKNNSNSYKYFSGLAIGSLLLMIFPFLLNLMPLASVLQFSFRLLLITGFALSMVAGIIGKNLADKIPDKSTIIVIVICAIIVIDFFPANSFAWTDTSTENFINEPAQVEVLKALKNVPGYFVVLAPLAQVDYMYHGHYSLGWGWAGFRQGALPYIWKDYSSNTEKLINMMRLNNFSEKDELLKTFGFYGVRFIVMPCFPDMGEPAISNGKYCAFENEYFRPLVEGDVVSVDFDIDEIEIYARGDVLVKVANYGWTAYGINHNQKEAIELLEIRNVYPGYMNISFGKDYRTVQLKQQ